MANNVEITKDILREAIKAQERLLNYWDKDKDTKQYYEVVGKKWLKPIYKNEYYAHLDRIF